MQQIYRQKTLTCDLHGFQSLVGTFHLLQRVCNGRGILLGVTCCIGLGLRTCFD